MSHIEFFLESRIEWPSSIIRLPFNLFILRLCKQHHLLSRSSVEQGLSHFDLVHVLSRFFRVHPQGTRLDGWSDAYRIDKDVMKIVATILGKFTIFVNLYNVISFFNHKFICKRHQIWHISNLVKLWFWFLFQIFVAVISRFDIFFFCFNWRFDGRFHEGLIHCHSWPPFVTFVQHRDIQTRLFIHLWFLWTIATIYTQSSSSARWIGITFVSYMSSNLMRIFIILWNRILIHDAVIIHHCHSSLSFEHSFIFTL